MAIDPARLESQLRRDADILQVLTQRGDLSTIPRPIDLLFLARPETAEAVKREIEKAGWFILRTAITEAGLFAVEVQVEQTAHLNAITALTRAALEIEARTGADYDGWGTQVTKSN